MSFGFCDPTIEMIVDLFIRKIKPNKVESKEEFSPSDVLAAVNKTIVEERKQDSSYEPDDLPKDIIDYLRKSGYVYDKLSGIFREG